MINRKYGVKLNGLADLEKDMKSLSDLDRKAVKDLLKKAAQPMVDGMRLACREKTGRLSRSIKMINPDDHRFPFTILIGPDYTPDGEGTITIAALASIHEYGAAERFPKKKESKKVLINGEWVTMSKSKPFKAIPPRPFFRPAIDQYGASVVEEVYKGLQQIILNSKTKIIKK